MAASRKSLALVALATAFCLSAGARPVSPAQADEIPIPSDPAAKAAFDVLEKHCSRCHQEGRLTKRQKPAKNFGNILRLDELAKTPHLILPGNPDGSLLFNQIAKREMPYDLYNELDDSVPTPSAEEIQALRSWIEGLGTTAVASCQARKFVSDTDVVAQVAADLERLPDHRVKATRYLTLTHFFNACADDKELEAYRQGAIKLVNSLSRNSDIVRLETIDPERTVLRINLDDLGWEEADWNTILAVYPYGVKPDTKLFGFVQQATNNTQLPYVRADWFAFTAAQPPLYNKLLKLPANFKELQTQQGLDIEADIRKFLVQRAGFQNSGVSQNNRLIERHQIRTGYLWTSYDFAGNREKQSLFKFPLGPGGEFGFEHNGGETIFSLPNGFQGYYLSKADGESLDKGPTNIVRDLTRKDLTVTNGISCMGCHDQGIRKAKDDVRAQVLTDRSFPKEVRDKVEALYPPSEKLDKVLEDDAQRFRTAMERAGLDPGLKLNGIEMINALAARYEANVDLRLAAAEFGLKPEGLKDAAAGSGAKTVALVRRLEQGLVPRDQFETEFSSVAPALTDESALDLKSLAAGQQATGSQQAAGSKQAPAAAGQPSAAGGGQPAGAALAVAKPTPGPKELTRTFDLALTSDKAVYKQNERAVFTVVTKEDCHLTLIDVDGKGTGTIIFPNKFQQDNLIRAGKEFRFGDETTPFRFRLADKGTETVIAECNATNPTTRGFTPDFKAGGFTELGNYEQRLTRQIAVDAQKAKAVARQIKVEAADAQPKTSSGKAADTSALGTAVSAPNPGTPTSGSKSDIVGRTAIKIEVQ